MATVQLMTQAEYAKHRGCSAVAVFKAVQDERISLINGKIDPTVADIQWAANTRARASVAKPAMPRAAQAPAVVTEAPGQMPLAPPPAAAEPPAPSTEGDYQKHRTSREQAEAQLAHLKLLEQQGVLVNVEQVRAEFAKQVAAVRDGLLQLPGRLAPVLASETDLTRVKTAIDTEIRAVLSQFTAAEGSA